MYSVYFTTVPDAPQLPEPAFHDMVSVPSAFSVTVGAALFQDMRYLEIAKTTGKRMIHLQSWTIIELSNWYFGKLGSIHFQPLTGHIPRAIQLIQLV